MANVLSELSKWSSNLPYWEQSALEKIVSGATFTDADYDQLLQYLLEDEKLAGPILPRLPLEFPQDIGADQKTHLTSVRINQIHNLKDVNALVPGYTLTFGPNLTVVYGANASGKSSYVRVLASSAFARGVREILPDITKPVDAHTIPTADMEVFDGSSNMTIHYEKGTASSVLSSLYVFDTTSVDVHLSKENAISFSPAGFSYLTILADIIDEIRKRLQNKIAQLSGGHTFNFLFLGEETQVSKLIANLGPKTDLEELQGLATLTPNEQQRLEELDLAIARLKSANIPAQILALKQTIGDLESLIASLRILEQHLSDQVVKDVQISVKLLLELEISASQANTDQFKSGHLTEVGSANWKRFIESARTLAADERKAGAPYPQEGDYCLLCQQLLDSNARDLLTRLWKFLAAEAQTKLAEVQVTIEQKRKALTDINLDFFNDKSVSFRHLEEHQRDLLQVVQAFIESCRQRRGDLLVLLDKHEIGNVSPLNNTGIGGIQGMIVGLNIQLPELIQKDPAKEVGQLEDELRELQHRAILGQHFKEVRDYIERRKWAENASKISVSTRHVTTKHNQLFKQLVTDRYIQTFERNLKDLRRPLKVQVHTLGKKGDTLRQIVLESDPSAESQNFSPQNVLSDGEKRAVALADFLTEVELDEGCSGIVIDDPVTSFDIDWKETISKRLATEAKSRQVIVFTHDLHCLYLLKKFSEELGIDLKTHWIKRGDDDDKPGHVYLDNSPALEQDYRTTKYAQRFYDEAKSAPPEKQEALLRQGFGALRTTYEAFIIFDIFGGVVMRFGERISYDRLKSITWDQAVVEEVVTKFDLLSRYIEGHLHSDILPGQKPSLKILHDEIEAFGKLKSRHKGSKTKP